MHRIVQDKPISVIVHLQPCEAGIGSVGNVINIIKMILDVLEIIKNIFRFLNEIIKINNVYSHFEDTYGYSKEFVQKVIKNQRRWKKGFLESVPYVEKEYHERKIMRDCNFKYDIKNKRWINRDENYHIADRELYNIKYPMDNGLG